MERYAPLDCLIAPVDGGVFPACFSADIDYYTHTGTILCRKEDLQRFLSSAVRSGQNGISFRKEICGGMTDQEIVQVVIHTLSVFVTEVVLSELRRLAAFLLCDEDAFA